MAKVVTQVSTGDVFVKVKMTGGQWSSEVLRDAGAEARRLLDHAYDVSTEDDDVAEIAALESSVPEA